LRHQLSGEKERESGILLLKNEDIAEKIQREKKISSSENPSHTPRGGARRGKKGPSSWLLFTQYDRKGKPGQRVIVIELSNISPTVGREKTAQRGITALQTRCSAE